ncbi:MAG: SseB family protein, partial [Tabrizicola sp.]
MTDLVTLLDAAHAAVSADPENEALRLRFFERLADGEMVVLLAKEAEGETLEPQVFDLEDGPVVLVFDREERLAAFTGGIAPYAALPGRVIAGLLKGQGIGMGVNLGVAPSSMLLPAEAMDWLAETLEEVPEEVEA